MTKVSIHIIASLFALAPSAAQSKVIEIQSQNAASLDFSSASPHIFASTFGLLQQWTNTFFPFGHTIVPCEVPVNTRLYHARIDNRLPSSPEWFAFDAAMSYALAGTFNSSNMFTYKTTKIVKCLYFDGASASLERSGNLDSQMVFLNNNSANVPRDPRFGMDPGRNNHTSGDPNAPVLGAEYDRARRLCNFIRDQSLGGKGWGYESIVRMNAGFEMIWCDFDSPSVFLVSKTSCDVPSVLDKQSKNRSPQVVEQSLMALESLGSLSRPRNYDPHGLLPRTPFIGSGYAEWLRTTANRYGFAGGPGRGEVRVKVDSCAAWSFYDSGLKDQEHARISRERRALNISGDGIWTGPRKEGERKAALLQLERRRRLHRANNVSEADGIYMREAIETRMRISLDPTSCSGIDWQSVTEEIVMEYSSPLQELGRFFETVSNITSSNEKHMHKWLAVVRSMGYGMLMPYYEYPSQSEVESSIDRAFDMANAKSQSAYQRCKSQHSPPESVDLAESERMIYNATLDVLGEMCRVVLTVFLSVEVTWYSLNQGQPRTSDALQPLGRKAQVWQHEIEELMAWLGWADQWTKCDPGCGSGEICWIPMWPLDFATTPPHITEGGLFLQDTEELLDDKPPSGPPHRGRRHGPGYYGPPGRGNERLLWQPQCVDRVELFYRLVHE